MPPPQQQAQIEAQPQPQPQTQEVPAQTPAQQVTNPEEESKVPVAESSPAQEESKVPAQPSSLVKPTANNQVVRNFNVNTLETFQKYKILGAPAQAAKLKSIFANYVCVGDNIFSTTQVDDQIDFETKTYFFGRKFTILI